MNVFWQSLAKADLTRIRLHIGAENPGAARSMLSRIFAVVQTLEDFPRRGRVGRNPDSRELVIPRTPYLVVYRIEGDEIQILRVLHGAQNWPGR